MRIGIDANLARTTFGGIGNYTSNIITALSALSQDEILAFIPKETQQSIDVLDNIPNLMLHSIDIGAHTTKNTYEFRALWEQTILPAHLDQYKLDVFFGPVFMVPLSWNGPTVTTVHDLAFERSSEYNPRHSTSYYLRWSRKCAEKAHKLVAISHFTANDIKRLWNIDDTRIQVVYLAPSLHPALYAREQSQKVASTKLGIDQPYILYVGTHFPRKNLANLLQAYSQLSEELTNSVRLVLVTDQDAALDSLLVKHHIFNKTIVTGYCEPEVMPHLYAAAEMLVYPSLFEGFGLPPLEAMLSKTPVIASNTSAIPEIVADAALLVHPEPDELQSAMQQLLTDEDLRRDLVLKGSQRVQQFSWNKTAKETRAVLASATTMRK